MAVGTCAGRVLWHGHEHAAARTHGLHGAAQHGDVVLDMLEDIEGADHVPLGVERHAGGVELEEVGVRDPLAREPQPLRVQLGGRNGG